MNKRLKTLLVMLLIVPCMLLFAGCKGKSDAASDTLDEVAYKLWLENGHTGSWEDFLEYIKSTDEALDYLSDVASFVSTAQDLADALKSENAFIYLMKNIELEESLTLDGEVSKTILGNRKAINAGINVINGAELIVKDLNIYPATSLLLAEGKYAVHVGENSKLKMYNCDVSAVSTVKALCAIYIDTNSAFTYLDENVFKNGYAGLEYTPTYAFLTDSDQVQIGKNTFRCEGTFAVGFGYSASQYDIVKMFTTQISRSWFNANSDTIVYAANNDYGGLNSIITLETFIEWLQSGSNGIYFKGVID